MSQADPARAKFFFIASHRLLGAAFVVLGLLCLADRLDWGHTVGWVLFAVGLIDFFVAPIVFTRLWKSKE